MVEATMAAIVVMALAIAVAVLAVATMVMAIEAASDGNGSWQPVRVGVEWSVSFRTSFARCARAKGWV